MIKISVKDVQGAKDVLRQKLKELMTDKFVTLGIHEDRNARQKGKINNATLGAIQHFGNDRIPARPWLDVGVAQGNKEYVEIIKANIENPEQALEQIGVIAVGKVQQYIVDLRTPPNTPATIKAKGSSNPLIDTGALRQSVTYKITTTKPNEGVG